MAWRKIDANKNIAMGIYTICVGIIIVFLFSHLHLLNTAGSVANNVRLEVERDLVRNEIDRQVALLARDQRQISHWDKTVEALTGEIDKTFVEEELADWLWEDFGIQNTIVVGADGKPQVSVFEDEVLAANEGAAFIARNVDLIAAARKIYLENRTKSGDGFVIAADRVRNGPPLYAFDFRIINGQTGIVVAQAIIPDDEAVLPPGLPQVLLTFKPLSDSAFAEIGQKLGLTGFHITPENASDGFGQFKVSRAGSAPALKAIWKASSPSATIWSRSLPVVVTLFLVIAMGLGIIAVRFGRALKALQTSEARNRFLAFHDALTGLPNRLQFDSALEEIICEGNQNRCAVLCVDLDRFKAVNDTYGHQAGDTVIQTVANRIADIVGDKGLAARVGGDEFIILLREQLDRDTVLFLCDSLIESVCQDVRFDGGSAMVGASIGVAWWPDDALTAKTIIRSADEALYRSKENGRCRTSVAGDITVDGVDTDTTEAVA